MGFLSWLGGVGNSLIGGAAGTAANSIMQNQSFKQQNKMFDKQKNFWYEQQEYNSPENQRQRFEDAGFNPNFALGNIQSGQMGSMPSPSSAAAQGGTFGNVSDSVLSVLRGRNESKLAEAQENKLNQDATLAEIDGYTRGMKNVAEIANIISSTDKNKGDSLLSRVQADATDLLSFMQYNKGMAETAKIASETENNWLNYAKGLKELQFLPVQQRMAYLEAMASIANIEANTKESVQRKIKLIQETNHEYFKSQGQKFVNELNKKTEQFLIHDRKFQPTKGISPFGILPMLDFQFNK